MQHDESVGCVWQVSVTRTAKVLSARNVSQGQALRVAAKKMRQSRHFFGANLDRRSADQWLAAKRVTDRKFVPFF